MNHQPLLSVVVCSYNGQTVVGRAVESLLAQDYPKNRYEIIVVNDGSTDNTAAIAKALPIRYIEHEHNQGLSTARNTGLKAAKGEIYVGFDDDCVAAPDYLTQLVRGYQERPEAIGIGAIIAHPARLHGIADHYMAANGSGNQPSLGLDARQNPLQRFLAYIKDQARPPQATTQKIIPVRQINGATASFPIDLLRAVGGWDASLSGIEDTDLCSRLASANPNRFFYATIAAVLTHDPKLTFKQLLRRPFLRGSVTLAYYRRNHLIPPLFPFPILWLFLVLLAALSLTTHPILAILIGLATPSALYFWWPIRAFRERQPRHVIFPYVQLSEELSALAGLVRGYLIQVSRSG